MNGFFRFIYAVYEIKNFKRKIYNQAGYNPQNIDLNDIFWKFDSITIREILRQIYYRNPYTKPPPEGMYT